MAELKYSEIDKYYWCAWGGDIVHFGTFGCHLQNTLDHLHVLLREVPLTKLPDINEIAINDERFRLDTLQVLKQLFGMTTVST